MALSHNLLIGPLAAADNLTIAHWLGLPRDTAITRAVTVWCTRWRTIEPISHPVTALLPLGIFTLLGVLTHGHVAQAYRSHLILLPAGGFMLSTARQSSGADQC